MLYMMAQYVDNYHQINPMEAQRLAYLNGNQNVSDLQKNQDRKSSASSNLKLERIPDSLECQSNMSYSDYNKAYYQNQPSFLFPTCETIQLRSPTTGSLRTMMRRLPVSPLTVYYYDESAPNKEMIIKEPTTDASPVPNWKKFTRKYVEDYDEKSLERDAYPAIDYTEYEMRSQSSNRYIENQYLQDQYESDSSAAEDEKSCNLFSGFLRKKNVEQEVPKSKSVASPSYTMSNQPISIHPSMMRTMPSEPELECITLTGEDPTTENFVWQFWNVRQPQFQAGMGHQPSYPFMLPEGQQDFTQTSVPKYFANQHYHGQEMPQSMENQDEVTETKKISHATSCSAVKSSKGSDLATHSGAANIANMHSGMSVASNKNSAQSLGPVRSGVFSNNQLMKSEGALSLLSTANSNLPYLNMSHAVVEPKAQFMVPMYDENSKNKNLVGLLNSYDQAYHTPFAMDQRYEQWNQYVKANFMNIPEQIVVSQMEKDEESDDGSVYSYSGQFPNEVSTQEYNPDLDLVPRLKIRSSPALEEIFVVYQNRVPDSYIQYFRDPRVVPGFF